MASSGDAGDPLSRGRPEVRRTERVDEVSLDGTAETYRRRNLFHLPSRRMGYELRICLWLGALGLTLLSLSGALLHAWKVDALTFTMGLLLPALLWLLVSERALHRIVIPLQTLANVIAAIRSEDYSFRVRGGRRGDAAGDLALEINLLSASLQAQKREAKEARALVDRVLSTIEAPVLAFSEDGRLALRNQAAVVVFSLQERDLGSKAIDLGIEDLLAAEDRALLTDAPRSAPGRWMLRRSIFRLQGRRHVLVMLTEIGSALREEERQAWQRLIRVLGHEINNSLAPIKSIAGSLQQRLSPVEEDPGIAARDAQLRKGLGIIEARADSLNRFLQAYRTLSALPPVERSSVALLPFLQRLAALEQRVPVALVGPCDNAVRMDPVLIEQAMINLLKNAAEATLERASTQASPQDLRPVEVRCERIGDDLEISIRDFGLGILNEGNLFVPFYTTKPEGSGIGLVLAQRIAEAHEGTLQLMNAAGDDGCIARFRFPAAQV